MLIYIPEWCYRWKNLLSAAQSWVCLTLSGIIWHFSQYAYASWNACLVNVSLFYILRPPSVGISPEFVHLILHNPRMLNLYWPISCKSSSSLPSALRVHTFHVAVVMFSLRCCCAGPLPIRYGYSIIHYCHLWCALGISIGWQYPLLFRLQVFVDLPSPWRFLPGHKDLYLALQVFPSSKKGCKLLCIFLSRL